MTSSAVAHRSGTISRKPTASTIERMASSLEPTFLYLSVKVNRDQSVIACGCPTHRRLDGLEATALTGSLLLPTTQSTDVTRLSRRFSGAVDLWGRATSGSRVRIGIARLRSPSGQLLLLLLLLQEKNKHAPRGTAKNLRPAALSDPQLPTPVLVLTTNRFYHNNVITAMTGPLHGGSVFPSNTTIPNAPHTTRF
jgi:hypothetical protein